MKTLGICIPTYKRPAFLRRCVLSAIESAQGRPLQIFISDDSVSDTNTALLAELCRSYPFVHAHRNPVNLGIDDNIQHVVETCDSDFAWLVGEDDTFLAGAVARIEALIQRIDVPFIFANYAYVGEDPALRLGQALPLTESGPIDAGAFLAQYLWAVGFLGACVVRKQEWSLTSPQPYSGTYYTHVGRIAEMISKTGSAFVNADCSVANRVEGEDTFTWKRDSYGVFFGFLSMCRRVALRRPEMAAVMQRAADGMERRYGWLTLRVAVRLRSEHAFDLAQYRKYLRNSSVGFIKKVVFAMISVTPPCAFRPLVRAYRAGRSPS